jgi:hypothetical protein
VDIRQNKAVSDYTYPAPDDPDYVLAVRFAKQHLSYIQSNTSIGEPLEFKGSSASGIIGKNTGTPKTEDHLSSPLFDEYKWNTDHIPVQIVQTKDEFLSPEDLERNKIRFVDCVPKEFLFKQKIFFDKQNKKLIKHCNEAWIKYGFVKQFGGFDRLCTSYEKCCVISFSDVSGYDIASVLLAVYMIRLFYLDISAHAKTPEEQEFIQELLKYVVYYTLNPVRLHPNGQIFQFDKSNSSGQNNTAPDNSILHEIITFYIFIVVWRDLFHVNPTYEEIMEHVVVSLYSDDKAVGYIRPFEPNPIRLKEIENEVYKKFGMTIKESASKIITHTPGTLFGDDEFEFLGSYNKWSEEHDCYFMIPRERKLATSATKVLTCTKKQLTPVDHYLKLVQLEIQLQNTVLEDPISFYRKWFQNKHKEMNLLNELYQIDYLKNVEDISPSSILYLATGRESSFSSSGEFNFLSSGGGGRMVLNSHMSNAFTQKSKKQKKPKAPKSKTSFSEQLRKQRANTQKQKAQNAARKRNTNRPIRRRNNGRPVYRGRGAYVMDPNDSYGTQWGGQIGSFMGELAGGAAQGLAMSYITGMGDYQVKSNALMPGLLPPVVNYNPHGGRVVRGVEYLGDIISSITPGAFKLQNFLINPALESSFPKLAQEACNYDEYVVEGLYFEYRAMSGTSATNQALGNVVMAANYNPVAPLFGSKGPMEEYDGAVSCVPFTSCKFFLECDRAQTLMEILLCRSNGVPVGQDARFFDIANFQIATTGVPVASANLGELWVSYQICLLKPKLFSSLGNFNSSFNYFNPIFTNAFPLGSGTQVLGVNNTQGFSIFGGTTLNFPVTPIPQSYAVQIGWTGTAVVISNPTRTATNCLILTTSLTTGQFLDSPATGTTSAVASQAFTVVVPGGNISGISFSPSGTLPAGTPGTNLGVQINVNQIANLLTGAP